MGFNQCILPSIIIMEAEIKSVGLETFVKRMQRYECITGESDRMQFLESKVKEYYEQNETTTRADSE
jgi:hypothetical protein